MCAESAAQFFASHVSGVFAPWGAVVGLVDADWNGLETGHLRTADPQAQMRICLGDRARHPHPIRIEYGHIAVVVDHMHNVIVGALVDEPRHWMSVPAELLPVRPRFVGGLIRQMGAAGRVG